MSQHTCAVSSIVSACFQQRTYMCSEFHCLRMFPAGHVSTVPTAARPGPPHILWHSCKCNSTLGTASPKGTRLNSLPALTDCPSSPAQEQTSHACTGWRITGGSFPGRNTSLTPAALRMRGTAFSLLACPQEGSQTHWTGAGFPPLPSGWQNFLNSFVQIPKRKDPTQGEGEG